MTHTTNHIKKTSLLLAGAVALMVWAQPGLAQVEQTAAPCMPAAAAYQAPAASFQVQCPDPCPVTQQNLGPVIMPVIIQPAQVIEVPNAAPQPGSPIARFNEQQQLNRQLQKGSDITVADASSAAGLNIETPIRCEIPFPTKEIISNIPMNPDDFKMTRLDKNDPLPRYEVNGYTFTNQPLDLAIQNLVTEAGIHVFSDDGLYPEISAEDVRGELSAVIEELVNAGDAYFRYDATKKKLYLSRWARFELAVPGGRVGLFAVLDALRGAGITNVQPDFGTNTLYFRVNTEKQAVIERLIGYLKEDPRLLMMDIKVYRLTERPDTPALDWQTIIQNFGVKRVNMSVGGIVGRMVITGHQKRHYSLIDSLQKQANVSLVSEGVAIMPNAWKVRFDIGQCARFQTPERDLSLLLQSNIQSPDRIESNISLDTINGEITSFYSFYTIDDNLSIIGIPGSVFNKDWKGVEYLITMQPRILRLVKEGE